MIPQNELLAALGLDLNLDKPLISPELYQFLKGRLIEKGEEPPSKKTPPPPLIPKAPLKPPPKIEAPQIPERKVHAPIDFTEYRLIVQKEFPNLNVFEKEIEPSTPKEASLLLCIEAKTTEEKTLVNNLAKAIEKEFGIKAQIKEGGASIHYKETLIPLEPLQAYILEPKKKIPLWNQLKSLLSSF